MIFNFTPPTDPEVRKEFDFCVSFLKKWATPARLAFFNKAATGEITWAAVDHNFQSYLDRLDEVENTYRVRPLAGVPYSGRAR
jgi:hypothetical protein